MKQWMALLLGILLLAGCGDKEKKDAKIVALGDSLTAGYGLGPDESFPAQLERKLKENGYHNTVVVNAGISGDTTQDGLARLPRVLEEQPDIVILALGANDMLRRVNPELTRKNLAAMLDALAEHNIPVLLAGMQMPTLMMAQADAFNAIFPELAEQYGVAYYPFFLEGVARDRSLNLPDGVHPNAQGIAVMVENVYPVLEEMLESR